jgi:CarD family transcriptional regulator
LVKIVVRMQNFSMGEYVFVAGHGVGQVLGEERKIEGVTTKDVNYFIVKLLSTGAKIQVPQREDKCLIRPLVSKIEVEQIYNFLAVRDNIKFNRQTWNRRYRDYMAKINTGSLREIAEVLREMLLIRADKKLSFSEKRVLDLCKEMLVKELSITSGSQEESVSETIDTLFTAQ